MSNNDVMLAYDRNDGDMRNDVDKIGGIGKEQKFTAKIKDVT